MDETVSFGDALTASVHEAVARLYPAHNPSAGYYKSGPELFVSVNVCAPDKMSAERVGAEILVGGLPSWISVSTVEARPLLADPDFTSPPSPS
ncbi:MAG: hypothetical protein ACRDQZ_17260 [Mycobacteriales bacterium]